MSKIRIMPDDQDLILTFKFYTPQEFFYTVTILNNKTGDIIYKDQGQWNDKTIFQLGKANYLLGNLLTINWSVIDPAGKDKNFSAEAVVSQNKVDRLDHLTCIGKTNDITTHILSSGLFIKLGEGLEI
jgi:hypothetical protein